MEKSLKNLEIENHLALTGNEVYSLIESTVQKLEGGKHEPHALAIATYTVLDLIIKERKEDALKKFPV